MSDVRNDAVLADALRRLPRGSGVVFRHYHLSPEDRRARFEALRKVARARGHVTLLAGTAREARRWRADGNYSAPAQAGASGNQTGVQPIGPRSPPARGSRIVVMTAHSLRDIRRAARADAVMLSPVFATRSHPGGKVLGPVRFRLLARHAQIPVIALGGMTAKRAVTLKAAAWAAIDGLSPAAKRRILKDS